MLKKLLLLALLTVTLSIQPFHESIKFPKNASQSNIINAIYQIGSSEKLTLVLVVNEKKIRNQDKELLDWIMDNLKSKLPAFWYCKHELENPKIECNSRHSKEENIAIKYILLSCYEPLHDLCDKKNIATLFIFKNGQILHKISSDILLSAKVLANKKEQEIVKIINETFRKAIVAADF